MRRSKLRKLRRCINKSGKMGLGYAALLKFAEEFLRKNGR